jgi:hypothetical protein
MRYRFLHPFRPPTRRGPFTFLFVGTLGYYPNEDAVAYFCAEVLARLRGAAAGQFQVDVIGTGGLPILSRLSGPPEVRVLGPVHAIAPAYAEPNAVIVPVRAGGGTRIKVLEAFAFQRPVVSTSLGVEGIDACPEEHVLIGLAKMAVSGSAARIASITGKYFSIGVRGRPSTTLSVPRHETAIVFSGRMQ